MHSVRRTSSKRTDAIVCWDFDELSLTQTRLATVFNLALLRLVEDLTFYNSSCLLGFKYHAYFGLLSVCGQKAEALECGTKRFEELEFCQLEEESRLEEKKEARCSQLLQERAEYHSSVANRKVRAHTVCGIKKINLIN